MAIVTEPRPWLSRHRRREPDGTQARPLAPPLTADREQLGLWEWSLDDLSGEGRPASRFGRGNFQTLVIFQSRMSTGVDLHRFCGFLGSVGVRERSGCIFREPRLVPLRVMVTS